MLQHERTIQYLERQNAALLKALVKKDDSALMRVVVEQQQQTLNLTAKIGELTERDALRARQMRTIWTKLNQEV